MRRLEKLRSQNSKIHRSGYGGAETSKEIYCQTKKLNAIAGGQKKQLHALEKHTKTNIEVPVQVTITCLCFLNQSICTLSRVYNFSKYFMNPGIFFVFLHIKTS